MPTVTLRPMTQDEYTTWMTTKVDDYTAEMVNSGMLEPEAARQRAPEQHATYLPQERMTPDMHLLRVVDDDGGAAGVLWLGPHPRKAGAGFVYDIAIDEDRRGLGLGRATMVAAEQVARDAGWTEIGLNVFGPNARARALYDSLGYRVVTTDMIKPL